MVKSKTLKVVIIAQYFPPDLGGSATRAYNVAKGLTLNGCDVTVITAFPHYPHGKIPKDYDWKPLKVEWMGKIKVIRTYILPLESKGLGRRIILFGVFIITSLFALPFVGNFDVVWSSNPDLVAIIPAIIYGEVKNRPVASNVDDLALEDLYDLNLMKRGSIIATIFELITRICYEKTALVTPISPGYIETLSKYGIEKSKIRVVEGGVDLNIFKQNIFNERVRTKFVVLYSGSFSLAYNFDQVLLAAKIIEEKEANVEFILQGKGELGNHICCKIRELDLKNVKLINKIISRKNVAELLNQANILLLPLGDYGKPHLGISAKLYEYQASGKPIICCSSGIPGTYVKETNSGYVVIPGEYKALADTILYLKNNPTEAQTLGKNGRKYVENNVSIQIIGTKMKKNFESLLTKYY